MCYVPVLELPLLPQKTARDRSAVRGHGVFALVHSLCVTEDFVSLDCSGEFMGTYSNL